MATVVRTPAAEADLEEIGYHIAITEQRPEIARNNLEGIVAACELYAENPRLGQRMEKLGAECRIFRFKRWVVVYRPTSGGIEVLRIVDGARDYARLF